VTDARKSARPHSEKWVVLWNSWETGCRRRPGVEPVWRRELSKQPAYWLAGGGREDTSQGIAIPRRRQRFSAAHHQRFLAATEIKPWHALPGQFFLRVDSYDPRAFSQKTGGRAFR